MYEIHTPHKIRHPSDVVLSRNDLEFGETLQDTAQDKDGQGPLDLVVQRGSLEGEVAAKEIDSGTLSARQDVQRERHVEI